jgi:hypothetical protein
LQSVGQSFSSKSSGLGKAGRLGTVGRVMLGRLTLGSVMLGRLTLGRVRLAGRWGIGTPASSRASFTPW